MPGATVADRVIVHLSGFLRHADAYECPVEMTQDGIAAALGISRAHAALEVKRLKSTGKVAERMAHVANARSRRKVYDLTSTGQEIARRIRDHVRAQSVVLVDADGPREIPGTDAIAALRRAGIRESEAVLRILLSERVEVPRPAPARPVPGPSRTFFGRARERERLRAWLRADGPTFAVVLGVAGIGKSALVSTVLEDESRPVLVRRLYPHDDAHGLLCSLAEFLARLGRRRLKAILVRPAYDPVEAIAVLRDDLRDTVVAFDDVHASPAAEGVLRAFLNNPPAAKVLLASRVQPSFYEASHVERGEVIEVPVDGLDDAAARELFASRGGTSDGDAAERALAAARGHPLFLELIAGSGLEAGRDVADRYLFDTVLEGLDDASETLLRTFAILRRPAKSPERLGAGLGQLRRLTRRSLLHHRPDGYLIHDLLREFFLRRFPEAERRTAHARAADYWAYREEFLEEAHHRIEAGDVDRAASLLAEIGPTYAESARAGDLEASLLRLPPERRPAEVLAETQMFLGKFADARGVLEDLVRDDAPAVRLRARIRLGRIANRMATYAEARTILSDAVREAERLREPGLEAEALRALGGVERKLGDLPAALGHLTRAASLLPDESRERVRALTDLGAALIARGDLPAAKARLLEARRTVRRGSREEVPIQINLGIIMSREGQAPEAAATFQRSAELAMRTGDMRFASYALANAVDNYLRLEDLDAAASNAERAVDLAQTIGDPLALSAARTNLGLVFARRGEWRRAEDLLLGSVELISKLENPYSLASLYEEIARLYESQGRAEVAAPWRSRAGELFGRLRGDGTIRGGDASTADM